MALHYNALFVPILFISTISCFVLKYSYLSTTYQVIIFGLYLIYFTVELIRLLLGFYGNLSEKIPALSGFWITSLVLQLPITLFLQGNLSIYPLPLERAVLAIHTIFLISQIVSGFLVIRTIAAYQIQNLKALLAE